MRAEEIIKRLLIEIGEQVKYDVRRMKKMKVYEGEKVRMRYGGREEKGYKVGEQIIFEDGTVMEGVRWESKKRLRREGDWKRVGRVEIVVSERGNVEELR